VKQYVGSKKSTCYLIEGLSMLHTINYCNRRSLMVINRLEKHLTHPYIQKGHINDFILHKCFNIPQALRGYDII